MEKYFKIINKDKLMNLTNRKAEKIERKIIKFMSRKLFFSMFFSAIKGKKSALIRKELVSVKFFQVINSDYISNAQKKLEDYFKEEGYYVDNNDYFFEVRWEE